MKKFLWAATVLAVICANSDAVSADVKKDSAGRTLVPKSAGVSTPSSEDVKAGIKSLYYVDPETGEKVILDNPKGWAWDSPVVTKSKNLIPAGMAFAVNLTKAKAAVESKKGTCAINYGVDAAGIVPEGAYVFTHMNSKTGESVTGYRTIPKPGETGPGEEKILDAAPFFWRNSRLPGAETVYSDKDDSLIDHEYKGKKYDIWGIAQYYSSDPGEMKILRIGPPAEGKTAYAQNDDRHDSFHESGFGYNRPVGIVFNIEGSGHVDFKTEKDVYRLEDSEDIKATLTNLDMPGAFTDNPGRFALLRKGENDIWRRVYKKKPETTFGAYWSQSIEPGKSVEYAIEPDIYPLKPGTYRIVKDIYNGVYDDGTDVREYYADTTEGGKALVTKRMKVVAWAEFKVE
ncbi:MAG: hypothetical protein LBU36_08490 [Clostridiales bacterium]|nr:hypothetical protein [Clostridiales bacterium]